VVSSAVFICQRDLLQQDADQQRPYHELVLFLCTHTHTYIDSVFLSIGFLSPVALF
jgi:hypothetical protein